MERNDQIDEVLNQLYDDTNGIMVNFDWSDFPLVDRKDFSIISRFEGDFDDDETDDFDDE